MHESGGLLQLDKYATYYLPPTTYHHLCEVVMADSINQFKNRLDEFGTNTTLFSLFQVTQ